MLRPEHVLASLMRNHVDLIAQVLMPLMRRDLEGERFLRDAGKAYPVEPRHLLRALFDPNPGKALSSSAARKLLAGRRRTQDEMRWDAVTWSRSAERRSQARHVRARDWTKALASFEPYGIGINSVLLGNASLNGVLHEAARAGAPAKIVKRLVALGAWRSLPNGEGDRPLDLAQRGGHAHLTSILTPVLQCHVRPDALRWIQEHFHAFLQARAGSFIEEQGLRLPELAPMQELPEGASWFVGIPGFYGGFSYRLDRMGGIPVLVTEGESRIVGGSYQMFVITQHGYVRVGGERDL